MKKALFLLCFISIVLCLKAQEAPTANELMKQARVRAIREQKKIFVLFQASWCIWCHKMDSSMSDPSCKDFFDKNYVTVHLTIQETEKKKDLENPGAMALYTKYGGDNEQGIPYWLVFDEQGKLLADSQIKPGVNTGCPATKQEVAYFMGVLKKTSSISTEQAAAIEKRFRQNN